VCILYDDVSSIYLTGAAEARLHLSMAADGRGEGPLPPPRCWIIVRRARTGWDLHALQIFTKRHRTFPADKYGQKIIVYPSKRLNRRFIVRVLLVCANLFFSALIRSVFV